MVSCFIVILLLDLALAGFTRLLFQRTTSNENGHRDFFKDKNFELQFPIGLGGTISKKKKVIATCSLFLKASHQIDKNRFKRNERQHIKKKKKRLSKENSISQSSLKKISHFI